MSRKALLHGLVALYLLVSLQAFLFTMVRLPPLALTPFVQFSFGMMAPFQGYVMTNEELRAEVTYGDGRTEEKSMEAFLPFIRGERAVRAFLVTFRDSPETTERAYARFRERVRTVARTQDPAISDLRLCVHRWPRSPGGYAFLHLPAFTEKECFPSTP